MLVSDTILKIRPPASPALRHTAWSLSAQAHFALGNYQQAEEAYKRTLQLTETADPRRKALTTGLAATIYKRGEERVAEGYAQEGAALFLRAARAAPDSPIHPKAQYDAAASLLAVESWSEATRVLEEFRTKHPEHELSEEAHRKLAYAYDRGGRPRQAAEEYLRLAQTHTEEQLRREALLRAARLFEQAGRPGDAVSTLEHYVDKFPQPAPEVVEVQQRLADIAATSGNNTERRRWLVAVIATDQQARHQRNERTRALAARARLELAQSDIAAFERSRLVAPVKRNLAQKLERMKGALSSLKEAAAYGVAPVTAAATYEMGRLYHELSRALLTSERPSNLNGEELAQYDLLLEEQAASFEQKAIEFYETNMRHLAAGYYDDSIAKTRKRLGELWPVRYAKEERGEPAVETLQ